MATFERRAKTRRAKVGRRSFSVQMLTFETMAATEAWARQVEFGKGAAVSHIDAARMTLREALARYTSEVSIHEKGAAQDLRQIEHKCHPLVRRTLASIRGADVASFRDEYLKQGASGNTVRLILATLSHLDSPSTAWPLATSRFEPLRDAGQRR